MPRRVVIEEFHLTVLVPRDLSDAESDAIRRTLADAAFEAQLLRAVRRVFRRHPSLNSTRVRLSR
jgi:hypothetical protein